jgi:hypothetical protein
LPDKLDLRVGDGFAAERSLTLLGSCYRILRVCERARCLGSSSASAIG